MELGVPESKQEVTKVVSFVKIAENLPSDSSPLKVTVKKPLLIYFRHLMIY